MKSKKYFIHKKSMVVTVMIMILLLLLTYGLLAFKIFFDATTKVPVSFTVTIYFLVSVVHIALGLGLILPYDTGTIRYEDEYFIFKKSIFSPEYYVEYKKLHLIYITFQRTPSRFHSPMGKAVFIYDSKKNYFRIELNPKIIQELLNHVDPKIIEVEFRSFLSFRKKYRALLFPYLSETDQNKIKQKYPLEYQSYTN